MAKQVKIRIYPDGRIEAETVGIKGQHCLDYIKILEGILEAETVESKFTAEYYQAEIGQVQLGEQRVEGK